MPPAVVPPCTATIPVPPMLANAAAKPLKDTVGLPETPLPFVIDKPEPVTAIERAVTAFEAVLTMTPVPAASRLPEAPFNVMVRAA